MTSSPVWVRSEFERIKAERKRAKGVAQYDPIWHWIPTPPVNPRAHWRSACGKFDLLNTYGEVEQAPHPPRVDRCIKCLALSMTSSPVDDV